MDRRDHLGHVPDSGNRLRWLSPTRRVIDIADTRLDEECERLYPARRSGAVEIGLKGGKKVSARVLDPKGEGENPMSDADLERKFAANCEPLIGKQR